MGCKGKENLWNADSLLELSEELQSENEKYRLKVTEQEDQIRTHLSDVQKLKLQIRSLQSTIAEQGQEIQNLNGHIARLAEGDLVLVENEELREANRKLQAESEKSNRIKQNMEADMKEKLQAAIQKQTVTLSIWTWAFCFICMIQTGDILFMNKDVVKRLLGCKKPSHGQMESARGRVIYKGSN